MNKKNYVLFLFLMFVGRSLTQEMGYTKCSGGISLSPNNFYGLSFQGKKGIDKKKLKGYETTIEVTKNQIWLFFDPPSSGLLNLNIKNTKTPFHTYIFKEKGGELCSELDSKKAKLIFSEPSTTDLNAAFLFTEEALRYGVLLMAGEGIKDSLEFSFDFSPQDKYGNEIIDSLLFDLLSLIHI